MASGHLQNFFVYFMFGGFKSKQTPLCSFIKKFPFLKQPTVKKKNIKMKHKRMIK